MIQHLVDLKLPKSIRNTHAFSCMLFYGFPFKGMENPYWFYNLKDGLSIQVIYLISSISLPT